MRESATTQMREEATCEEAVESDALVDLIECHLKLLSEKILGPHTPQELQAEVTELSDLLTSFGLRAELVAKLLDGSTPQDQRDSISAMLQATEVRGIENRQQSSAVLLRATELIKRSASLISRAQKEINRTSHLFAGYTVKACGLCKGVETSPDEPCGACKGRGSVLVQEPATKCHRCDGDGKTKVTDPAVHYSSLCIECNGTGWERMRTPVSKSG